MRQVCSLLSTSRRGYRVEEAPLAAPRVPIAGHVHGKFFVLDGAVDGAPELHVALVLFTVDRMDDPTALREILAEHLLCVVGGRPTAPAATCGKAERERGKRERERERPTENHEDVRHAADIVVWTTARLSLERGTASSDNAPSRGRPAQVTHDPLAALIEVSDAVLLYKEFLLSRLLGRCV
jgi:hypothetical protein